MVNNKTGICSLELGNTVFHENRQRPIFKYVAGEGLVVVGYIPWDEYIKQQHDIHTQQQTKRKK